MLPNHQKNDASTAELCGPCSSKSEDLEYLHSNSNRKLDPSIDEPPPYTMADNTNDQVSIPLPNMQFQPARENGLRRSSLVALGFTLASANFTLPSTNFKSPSVSCSFNLTLRYTITIMILATFAFCFWVWVSSGRPKTP